MNMKQACVWVLAAVFACQVPTIKMRAQAQPVAESVADPGTTATTREQLLTLLRVSPTLTTVVAADPSLLANQEYVSKSNPELAKYLAQHPEIARNPEFYLFADIHTSGPGRVRALERRVWTGEADYDRRNEASHIVDEIIPMLVSFAALAATAWLIKVILTNRRWNRVFRLQTDVHSKLIDRFGTSQEVLSYMQTESGKRFLEAAPISVEIQQEERWPSVLQRVLMPLTAGIVLTLLGIGLLFLRHSIPGGETPLLLFGVVALMPGLGCIISAGITWVLAQRLGMLPGQAL